MKSLEYVKENYSKLERDKFLQDKRWTKRFLEFIPVEEWGDYGFSNRADTTPELVEWTEENVLKQLRKDVEFAIEKAINHRGISASLMHDVLASWCEVLENGLEDTSYGWYGDKLIKDIDALYDFGLVNEDTFDENFYREW